jgi:hypothetical protein
MGSSVNLNSDKATRLVQIAPGVHVDTTVVRIDPARKYLLMDVDGYTQIGLNPDQRNTLSRLYQAGQITLYQVSPRVVLLDLESWHAHLKRVAEDPWYWEDRRRLNTYRGSYE